MVQLDYEKLELEIVALDEDEGYLEQIPEATEEVLSSTHSSFVINEDVTIHSMASDELSASADVFHPIARCDASSAELVDSSSASNELSPSANVFHPIAPSDVASALPVDTSSGVSSETINVEKPVQQTSCHSTKTAALKSEELFFQCEALGTAVNPQCGACKCGTCPIPGSKYSYSCLLYTSPSPRAS